MDFLVPISGTLLLGGGLFKIMQLTTGSIYKKLSFMPNLAYAQDGTEGYFTGRITADTLQPFKTEMGMLLDLVLVQRRQVRLYEDTVRNAINGTFNESTDRTTTSVIQVSRLVSDTGIQSSSIPFLTNGTNKFVLDQDMFKYVPLEKVGSVFEMPNEGVNVNVDVGGVKNDGILSRKNIGLRTDTLGVKNNRVFTYYGRLVNGSIVETDSSTVTKTSHEINVLNAKNDYMMTEIVSNTLLAIGFFGMALAFGINFKSDRGTR